MKNKIYSLSLTSVLFALAVVLSFAESLFPPVFSALPGVKIGLSNIVTMYALILISPKSALCICFLKAFFVLVTKGAVACSLSLTGGFLAVISMIIFKLFKAKTFFLGIIGGVMHNVGQLIVISFIYSNPFFLKILPVYIIFGCIFGSVTAVSLKLIMPAISHIKGCHLSDGRKI